MSDIKKGDWVKATIPKGIDRNQVKWPQEAQELIGKVGKVGKVLDYGDVIVKYKGYTHCFTPFWLTKVDKSKKKPSFKVGDTVKVCLPEDIVENIPSMKVFQNTKQIITSIKGTGTLRLGDCGFMFMPAWVKKVKKKKNKLPRLKLVNGIVTVPEGVGRPAWVWDDNPSSAIMATSVIKENLNPERPYATENDIYKHASTEKPE